MIRFVVEGTAVPKQRPRLGGRTAYTPKKTRDYEERVRIAFRSSYSGSEPVFQKGTPVRAFMEVIQGIPKSWSNKKHIAAERGEIVPTSRNGDLDNIAKSILDALNGVVYEDDCQVTTLFITKKYGNDPYTSVRIEEDMDERIRKDLQVAP
jgi:Holliday junction resolvase RusA-like endonuclease